MKYELTNIKIKKLFGEKNYDIYLKDNRLVIFAENGSGKTNIINIIAYFLSKEWGRLLSFPFESIECTINEKIYKFDRNDYERNINNENFKEFLKKNNVVFREEIYYILNQININSLKTSNFAFDQISFILNDSGYNDDDNKINFDLSDSNLIAIRNEMEKLYLLYMNKGQFLNNNDFNTLNFYPILLLPTYRKIEKDFHHLMEIISGEIKFKALENNLITEVVKYGMGDIISMIESYSLKNLDESSNNPYHTVLNKEAYENIQKFLTLINEYIGSKKQIDEINAEIKIISKSEKQYFVSFESLSSGEKQIISIFAYLHFRNLEYFVIIDEPEISLSLPWQKRILVDIQKNCKGYISTTHSPFISEDVEVALYEVYLRKTQIGN
jgi:energy-coupling factor transporter ATP-binding protein EcfA2